MVGGAELEVRFKKPRKKFTQLCLIIITVSCLLCFKVEEDRMGAEGTTERTFITKLKTFCPVLHFECAKLSTFASSSS